MGQILEDCEPTFYCSLIHALKKDLVKNFFRTMRKSRICEDFMRRFFSYAFEWARICFKEIGFEVLSLQVTRLL